MQHMPGINKIQLLLLTTLFFLPLTNALSITSYQPLTYENEITQGQSKTFSIVAENATNYSWYLDGELQYDDPIIELAEDAFNLEALNFTDDFFIGAQDHHANGFTFGNNGNNLYILGLDNAEVYQYNLPNPYDLTDIEYLSSYYLGTEDPGPSGITFSNDGTYMFITGQEEGKIFQYLLTEAFNVETASIYQEFDSSNEDGLMLGISFSNAGSKMFTVGADFGKVYQYNLDPAYDIATSNFVKEYVVQEESEPSGITFNNDGTIMYILGQTEVKIYEYYLSEAYNVETAVYHDEFYVGDYDQHPYDLAFDTEGAKIFMLGLESNRIYESNLEYIITEFPYNDSVLTLSPTAGIYNIEAFASNNGTNVSREWQLTVLNQETVNYISSGGARNVNTCVEAWECDPWSECQENNEETRTCYYVGTCEREDSRFCAILGRCNLDVETYTRTCNYNNPVKEVKEAPKERVIGQLLDIIFGIRDNNITSANKLVAESEYISFGTEPARVNLTYIILNSKNETMLAENSQIVVETELFVKKEFKDLALPEGNYRIILQTIYGNDVRTDFEQVFEINKEPIKNDEMVWIISLILIAISVILINYLLLTYKRN